MSLFKNTSGQKVRVFAFDATTGLPKSGDAGNITASISKDFGAFADLTDTSATEEDSTKAKGYYLFDISQAETNADDIAITGRSGTSNIVVVGAPARMATRPPNAGALSIDSSGRVDVIKINGTSQTARDIGASVLLSPGTGTGQVSLTAGVLQADVVKVNGTTPTLATSVDSNVTSINSISTSNVTTINANVGTTQPVNFTGTGATAYVKVDVIDIKGTASAGQAGYVGVDYANWVNTTTTYNFSATTVGTVGTLAGTVRLGATQNLYAPAVAGDAMTLTSGERSNVAAALLDLANGVETSVTVRQALRAMAAVLAGDATGAGTGAEAYKAIGNPGTTRVTPNADSGGNRTGVTLNL